jgi:hypothetical protein
MPASHDLLCGCTVALGDVPAVVHAADIERSRAMAPVLGALPFDERPPLVEVTYSAATVPVPTRPPDETHGPLGLWREGELLRLSYADGRVTATATGTAIRAGGDGVDLADAWRFVFHFALAHVLAQHGRYLLHAGAIADDDGALILTGESGSGKSTLVLAAVEAGWSALSDDLVAARPGETGAQVCGIAKPFRVPSELLAATASTAVARPAPRDRSLVNDHAWLPGWVRVRAPVAVGHNDSPHAELSPVRATDAVELAVGAFIGMGDPSQLRAYLPVAAAIGRHGGHRLRHGKDPSTRLLEAAGALAPLRAP